MLMTITLWSCIDFNGGIFCWKTIICTYIHIYIDGRATMIITKCTQLCICRRVAPDYAEDLSIPILDFGPTQYEREIGSSTIYSAHVLT